ncbi:DUF4150 domain-containing protein [Candidatus Desantisbacteria bacterium]|nr:DUF4150 domain-containing protein [Candidatus Desantisbacteria bacterium]
MGQPIATQTSGGQCFAFPDVCKTPAGTSVVPIPYPNIGDLGSAIKVSMRVKIGGKPVILQDSEIPTSSGDEAGSAGGIISGGIKGKVTFVTSSMKVKVEGKSVVRMGDTTQQNGTNAVGTVLFGYPTVMAG